MAKDPAFLFYTNDFERGVQFFSDEQVGKYLRLLMAQHQHGHLPEKHMNFICKSYDNDVFSKFVRDSDGNYYNERLELEILRRKNYVESRGKNKIGKKHISKSYDDDMENENENEIKNEVEINKPQPKKFNPVDFIPDSWNSDLFLSEWADFMMMRVKKKWSCTPRVLTERIRQLRELSGDDWGSASAMLFKSTEKGYAEFFAPDRNGSTNTSQIRKIKDERQPAVRDRA